jgi:hypothetical protein
VRSLHGTGPRAGRPCRDRNSLGFDRAPVRVWALTLVGDVGQNSPAALVTSDMRPGSVQSGRLDGFGLGKVDQQDSASRLHPNLPNSLRLSSNFACLGGRLEWTLDFLGVRAVFNILPAPEECQDHCCDLANQQDEAVYLLIEQDEGDAGNSNESREKPDDHQP